ncbi:MAG: hypothetical protein ABIG93_01960 [archaeon]|nr:hypothetical protein [Nanoarchaeota archaeon]
MERFESKSIVISRKPGKDKDGLWTAVIAMFDENNPHLKAKVPFKTVEYEDVIKLRLRDLANVSFYLMGNDLVINNLVHLDVHFNENNRVIILSGKQDL